MKPILILSFVIILFVFILPVKILSVGGQADVLQERSYWMLLQRKSNIEYLYFGYPGDFEGSEIVRTFKVKTGIPGKRPTPLPDVFGKKYWFITDGYDTRDSTETAPYFLTLNIPYTDKPPYGPKPYLECNGQCNWILPGSFGLHGVAGDVSRLSEDNLGSSGCVRHSDSDITYLYNLFKKIKLPIRYYISGN